MLLSELLKTSKNLTINISSLTINNHFHIKDSVMKTLQEILDEIATIAAAGNIADVQAQVDSVKATVAEHTDAIAANTADDTTTKASVADLQTIVETLVDKLAAAPATPPTT